MSLADEGNLKEDLLSVFHSSGSERLEMFTLDVLCKLISIDGQTLKPRTAYAAYKRGDLKAIKVAGKIVTTMESFEQWLSSGAIQGKPGRPQGSKSCHEADTLPKDLEKELNKLGLL